MPFDFVFAMQRWTEILWFGVGFLGQGIFAGRMLIQWLASEKVRKSVVPVEFWYMSVVGAMITLTYAIWREDPVFMVAQAGGLLVYMRNLYFIRLADPVAAPVVLDAADVPVTPPVSATVAPSNAVPDPQRRAHP